MSFWSEVQSFFFGSSKPARSRRQPAGLVNRGNTCFLNAILQALRSSPRFKSFLVAHPSLQKPLIAPSHSSRGGGEGSNTFPSAAFSNASPNDTFLFQVLKECLVDEKDNANVILNEIHTAMQKQQPAGMFVPLQQQDSHELFNVFLKLISDDAVRSSPLTAAISGGLTDLMMFPPSTPSVSKGTMSYDSDSELYDTPRQQPQPPVGSPSLSASVSSPALSSVLDALPNNNDALMFSRHASAKPAPAGMNHERHEMKSDGHGNTFVDGRRLPLAVSHLSPVKPRLASSVGSGSGGESVARLSHVAPPRAHLSPDSLLARATSVTTVDAKAASSTPKSAADVDSAGGKQKRRRRKKDHRRSSAGDLLADISGDVSASQSSKSSTTPPFEGLMASFLRCTSCHRKSMIRHNVFNSVSLSIPNDMLNQQRCSLSRCLNFYTQEEQIDDVLCSTCGAHATLGDVKRSLAEQRAIKKRKEEEFARLCALGEFVETPVEGFPEEQKIFDLETQQSKLQSAIDHGTEYEANPEQFEEDIRNVRRAAIKHFMFARLPQSLCLHVNRLLPHRKVGTHVDFDQTLSMKHFLATASHNYESSFADDVVESDSDVEERESHVDIGFGGHNGSGANGEKIDHSDPLMRAQPEGRGSGVHDKEEESDVLDLSANDPMKLRGGDGLPNGVANGLHREFLNSVKSHLNGGARGGRNHFLSHISPEGLKVASASAKPSLVLGADPDAPKHVEASQGAPPSAFSIDHPVSLLRAELANSHKNRKNDENHECVENASHLKSFGRENDDEEEAEVASLSRVGLGALPKEPRDHPIDFSPPHSLNGASAVGRLGGGPFKLPSETQSSEGGDFAGANWRNLDEHHADGGSGEDLSDLSRRSSASVEGRPSASASVAAGRVGEESPNLSRQSSTNSSVGVGGVGAVRPFVSRRDPGAARVSSSGQFDDLLPFSSPHGAAGVGNPFSLSHAAAQQPSPSPSPGIRRRRPRPHLSPRKARAAAGALNHAGNPPSDYELAAVVEHSGSAWGGHFATYRRVLDPKNSRSRWYYCSDGKISKVTFDEVRRCQAYILFYELQDAENERAESDKKKKGRGGSLRR